MQEYASFKSLLQEIPGTNDACERALGMVTTIEKRTTAPTSTAELANVIKITHSYRAAIRNKAKKMLAAGKKADTTTKNNFCRTFAGNPILQVKRFSKFITSWVFVFILQYKSNI